MSESPPRGAIHDIGYRPYSGPRRSAGQVAGALYVTGLRAMFGLGRSTKSKIWPLTLFALNVLPAAVMVAVIALVRLPSPPVSYAGYAITTMVLTSMFAAAQAPVLFSHDLRNRSIVLYLARPLSYVAYATMRWLSLATGLVIFMAVPVVVLAAGALLVEIDVGETLGDTAKALGLVVLLAAMTASVSGVASSISVRRGFGVMASIGVLLFGYGVVTAIQGIAESVGTASAGVTAGALNPFSLYAGLVDGLLDQRSAITPPESVAAVAGYVAAALIMVFGGIGLLLLRYKKVAER